MGKRDQPDQQDKCKCGHKIYWQCYIQNKNDKNDIRVVGTECVNKFISKAKLCFGCEGEHKNRVTTLCNRCRDGGWNIDLTVCPECNFTHEIRDAHQCDRIGLCDICKKRYETRHSCPQEIIECIKCFLKTKRQHLCYYKYLDWTKKSGKHKGLTWKEILIKDPNHIMWIICNYHSDNYELITYVGKLLKSPFWKQETLTILERLEMLADTQKLYC
jgi:ribosomal protein L37E